MANMKHLLRSDLDSIASSSYDFWVSLSLWHPLLVHQAALFLFQPTATPVSISTVKLVCGVGQWQISSRLHAACETPATTIQPNGQGNRDYMSIHGSIYQCSLGSGMSSKGVRTCQKRTHVTISTSGRRVHPSIHFVHGYCTISTKGSVTRNILFFLTQDSIFSRFMAILDDCR